MKSKPPAIGYSVADYELAGDCAPEATSFLKKRILHFFPDAVEIKNAVPESIDLIVEFSAYNPIIDEQSLYQIIETTWITKNNYYPVDDIPGTAPIRTFIPDKKNDAAFPFFYNTQPEYCTNFNVKRPNRAHIFNQLIEKKLSLATDPFGDFLTYIETDEIVNFILSYGNDLPVRKYSVCPGCDSKAVQKLYSGTSHPIMGYITKNISVYSHCNQCGLTFMNRQVERDQLSIHYQEHSYATDDRIGEAESRYENLSGANTSHFANYVAIRNELVTLGKTGKILDLGAGGGEFVAYARSLLPDVKIFACDWRFSKGVKTALNKKNISCVDGDFQDP